MIVVHMHPIFKYSGGKRRELKRIIPLLPTSFERVVEPFCGSAALAFKLERPALVADTRRDVIVTLRAVKDPLTYSALQTRLDVLQAVTDRKELEREFYRQRDEMWGCTDAVDIAYRFIVIRQLVFSGMERHNSSGKENAPFGWYERFKCPLSIEHHQLLQSWQIEQQDFEATLAQVGVNDAVFLDPPYLGRNSAYGDAQNDLSALHEKLISSLDSAPYPWLAVHCDEPSWRAFGARHKMQEHAFGYSQNFKGRDNSQSKTVHLYVSDNISP